MSNALMVTATWLIAAATLANVVVYWIISAKIEVQIALAKEHTELTRKCFLESNAPILSVALKKCEYSETERGLKLRIVIGNRGRVAANQVELSVSFGGSNERKKIDHIAVPPKEKITYTFLLPMGADRYATGQIEGNRFNALIEGSYIGLASQRYPYKARLDYDPELRCFVPLLMNW
jgi:hypothetical protein